MAGEKRKQLGELLASIAKEPAAEWDFTSEREKTMWLLAKVVDVLWAQAGMALDKVKPKKPSTLNDMRGVVRK